MEIKFQKKLYDFQYVLCFDLAKGQTGCALIDIINEKVIIYKQITVLNKSDYFVIDLYQSLLNIIKEIEEDFNIDLTKVVVLKEQCPQQCSKFSSISTLQSLAKAHCCLDLAIAHYNLHSYDTKGVHSVSVKAVFRRTLGIEQPSKEEISQNIKSSYFLTEKEDLTNDITDAVAIWVCLREHKWNADIKEQIKEYNKKIKKLKLNSAKEKIQEKIKYLEELKI